MKKTQTLKHCALNSIKSCLTASFLTWERNFEVTFGIFSVLVSQINVLESYLDYLSVVKLVMIKKRENCDNLGL